MKGNILRAVGLVVAVFLTNEGGFRLNSGILLPVQYG